ncbi:hypothetical protein BKA63DRAFT_522930 [Paraphoma chrysanthemicola]|nr:hypothetical protein BKA63DRAFT_522930 [Paraphoma chrysanthemicola]
MARSDGRQYDITNHYVRRQQSLRPYREPESDASDSDGAAITTETHSQPTLSRGSSLLTEASHESVTDQHTSTPLFGPISDFSFPAARHAHAIEPDERDRGGRGFLFLNNRRRGGRDSAAASPPRENTARRRQSVGNNRAAYRSSYEHQLASTYEHALARDERPEAQSNERRPRFRRTLSGDRSSLPEYSSIRDHFADDFEEHREEVEEQIALLAERGRFSSLDDSALESSAFNPLRGFMTGSTKRSRDWLEHADGSSVQRTLNSQGAVAALIYCHKTPDPDANDVWPEFRSAAKLPAHYQFLDKDTEPIPNSKSKRRPLKNAKKKTTKSKIPKDQAAELRDAPAGRPVWNLPVELVELIATHLNRDDIKSLRMVSQELNFYVSQVIFKTVVVPFNTEIYGMLGQSQKPDLKGKKRAKLAKPGYSWKNANGDEVYDGHGLDVFKGFGKHILRYGMSFEVNEDSLSQPPAKSLTEKKTSFWGNYDWPFEEYRRFDAVAGLETAADETPRMKIAFSELTRVKELALSVDSGLGWLNGPDRSIRARILQRPPAVFGTLKAVPDRRAQAQQELWGHIVRRHQAAAQDVRQATLYRWITTRPVSDLEESSMLAEEQPMMPYLDTHLIREATPYETTEVPAPASFDDPEVLDRFVQAPASTGAGILFSSITPPTGASQVMSPIIPGHLTKAQKEWLLETEWAQRAFMSSYMLSIIDNPETFTPVHTLTISRLSDRYLPSLNRPDFWDALPNLVNLTLMVIPGWRTVHKDEAGFVDTPRINPNTGLDPFCELLAQHIAPRSRIQQLKIGWIGGGEHAEGLHARNKLIMPAPLMPLGVRAENNSVFTSEWMSETDPKRLRAALLHFPHVERLVLRNCWITPTALLQFVHIYDALALKHLVLESVSLTAILRPNANVNQVAQPPAGGAPPIAGLLGGNVLLNAFNNPGAPPGQPQAPLPNNNQLLQWLVQNLQGQLQQLQANAGGIQQQNQIAALQAQLQQQIMLLQAQNQQQAQVAAPAPTQNQNLPNPQAQLHAGANQQAVTALAAQVHTMHQQIAAPPQPVQHAVQQSPANPQVLLHSQPREGSWLSIIDMISPGTNLKDFGSAHSKADPDRQSSLQSIEFVSCGYAKLPYATFDQAAIDAGHGLAAAVRHPVFTKRQQALAPAMMSAKWSHLGEIVQEVDATELSTLDAAWDFKTGWEDAEEARAVEFDGLLAGGTGRFTGKVQASDRLRIGDEAGSAS